MSSTNPVELPDDMTGPAAGGMVAILATAAAIWRAQLRNLLVAVLDVVSRRSGGDGELLDYKEALRHEREHRRDDIDQLRQLIDSIAERVRALEQTATTWKTDTVTTSELQGLQSEVQLNASRIGIDMSGLRDLLLEVLKRTR